MRHTRKQGTRAADGTSRRKTVPYDPKRFFESFYRANVRGKPRDSMTIGGVSEPESRFHYNATENSIIRGLISIYPLPEPAMVDAWTVLRKRRGDRMLDVGSGTGHWIDFMRDVFMVRYATATELSERMSEYLREKYKGDPDITIQQQDVTADNFVDEIQGGPFDYITAIGVMFHLVEDSRWRKAVKNLAAVLKPGGVLIVGDDFGVETRDVQFHTTDDFSSWREFKNTPPEGDRLKVNKRVRSLADWQAVAHRAGLEMVTLIRTDSDPRIITPENDILMLRRRS